MVVLMVALAHQEPSPVSRHLQTYVHLSKTSQVSVLFPHGLAARAVSTCIEGQGEVSTQLLTFPAFNFSWILGFSVIIAKQLTVRTLSNAAV